MIQARFTFLSISSLNVQHVRHRGGHPLLSTTRRSPSANRRDSQQSAPLPFPPIPPDSPNPNPVIWNPDFFTTPSTGAFTQIFIQADFDTLASPSQTSGFTSAALDPTLGTFAWPILAAYLASPTTNTTTVRLSIAAPLANPPSNTGSFVRIGAGTVRFPGPQVRILRAAANSTLATLSPATTTTTTTTLSSNLAQTSGSGGVNPLAIVLPVIFGVLTALAMIAYALMARHKPGWLAGVRRRVCCGGGRGDRVRLRGRDVEIKVVKTDLEGLRANAGRLAAEGRFGGGGGNAFREEVGRQDLERGRRF